MFTVMIPTREPIVEKIYFLSRTMRAMVAAQVIGASEFGKMVYLVRARAIKSF